MSGEKKGGSLLAKNGQTLAQIGAAVCNAVIDAGGNDQMTMALVLNNPAVKKALGDAVMRPCWEVTSNAKQTWKFIEEEKRLESPPDAFLSVFSPPHMETVESRKLTDGITYRLRGIPIRNQQNMHEVCNQIMYTSHFFKEPPLEIAVLLRMQIKPDELGFSCAVLVSPFLLGDTVSYPILSNPGALCCWPKSDVMDIARLPRGTVFIFLEDRK